MNVHVMHTHEDFDCVVRVHKGSVEKTVTDLLCYLETSERAYFWLPCQDTQMQTRALLGIQQGTCLFQWHLENKCIDMYNETLITDKNQLIKKKQTRRFLNCKAFLQFCHQNMHKTCTHWIGSKNPGDCVYMQSKIGKLANTYVRWSGFARTVFDLSYIRFFRSTDFGTTSVPGFKKCDALSTDS